MSPIEDARSALKEWTEHLTEKPSQSRTDRMANALRTLIADHDRLTADLSTTRRLYVTDVQGWQEEAAEEMDRAEKAEAQLARLKHADELLAYVDYCLGLPMYQNAISDSGHGAVETLRMTKRTLAEGLHPDALAAVAPWLAPDADAKLAAWRAECPEDRASTFPSRGWRDYAAARDAS